MLFAASIPSKRYGSRTSAGGSAGSRTCAIAAATCSTKAKFRARSATEIQEKHPAEATRSERSNEQDSPADRQREGRLRRERSSVNSGWQRSKGRHRHSANCRGQEKVQRAHWQQQAQPTERNQDLSPATKKANPG